MAAILYFAGGAVVRRCGGADGKRAPPSPLGWYYSLLFFAVQVGVGLNDSCFGHGQLYVAVS